MRRLLALRHTIRRHWQEDPVLFTVRVMRRYPSRAARAAIHYASKFAGLAPERAFSAVLALLDGQHAVLQHRIEQALERGCKDAEAKKLAEVCIAAGLAEEARAFLDRVGPQIAGRSTAEAKLGWYLGDMTEPLSRLPDGDPRTARIRQRFAGEIEVYGSWNPRLAASPGYVPRNRVVLHLVTNSLPHTSSGYAQRTHSLLRAQSALGWDVHVATRLGYPSTIGIHSVPSLEVIDGVSYHRLYTRLPIHDLRDRLQIEAEVLLALAHKVRPAVIHTTTHFINGLVARAVSRSLGIPWVYEVRGQLADTWASKRNELAVLSQRYTSFVRREVEVAHDADLVVTLGSAMKARLVEGGIDERRIVLAPNSIGESYLAEPGNVRDTRRRLRLEEDKVYIGTVSSLVAYEGIDDLLRAFAVVQAARPQARLLIVGDGESLPGLRALAGELGLEPKRIFAGRVPRPQAIHYHRALDIFCVPRKDFAVTRAVTPLKPVEAMASGKPVVASELPALLEMVRDGDTGRTHPAEDVAALAAILLELVDDAPQRERLGAAGREAVLSTRTWKRNATACIAKYHALSGLPRPESEDSAASW